MHESTGFLITRLLAGSGVKSVAILSLFVTKVTALSAVLFPVFSVSENLSSMTFIFIALQQMVRGIVGVLTISMLLLLYLQQDSGECSSSRHRRHRHHDKERHLTIHTHIIVTKLNHLCFVSSPFDSVVCCTVCLILLPVCFIITPFCSPLRP